jgi:hypothetical protein
MTSPTRCEGMLPRPSTQEGWNQWGTVDDLGNFTPVYGLPVTLSSREAMYELDAAGICDIQGKNLQGQPAPVETPKPATPALPTNVEPPTMIADVAPPRSLPSAGASGLIIGGLVLAGVAYRVFVASRKPPKSSDSKQSSASTFDPDAFTRGQGNG